MLHNLQDNRRFLIRIFLVIFMVFGTQCSFISMSVSANNLQINLQATYTFVLNRQYDPVNFAFIASPPAVPLNSQITITFPTQFLVISSTTSVSCTNSGGTDLGCTLNSATRTITVANYYSTSATLSDSLISITMNNIVNAYKSGASGNFFWQITDPNGTVIDQGPPTTSTASPTSLTFVGGTFQSCSITSTGNLVSTYSPFTFNLTPKNQIPSGGKLVINIPNSWSSDPTTTSTFINNPTCTEISGIGSSNLACSYSTQSAQLTITGLTQSISAAFSFQVSNILTPPTVGSGQVVTIFSEWSDGTSIDSCNSLITGLDPAPFQSISLSSNDNTTVQSSFTANLQLTLSRAFNYQDTIVFLLPTQFLSVSVSSTSFATITRTPNLNTLTLSNFPSIPATITSNNVITFTLSSITNPLSISPISLNVSFYRNNQIYQTSTVAYSATIGSLTSFSINPNSNFVQALGQAIFTLDSSLIFPSGSSLTITYPSTVSASTLTATSVTRCSLNGTIVTGTTFQVSNNQIIVKTIFSSNFQGTVVVIIPTFTNPLTVQPSTYLLAVNDQNNYGVMSSSFTFTANTKALISNTIATSSSTVLATGVTYTLSITTNFDYSAISIIVPTDISIATGFQNTCAPNNFSSCSLNGQNLTFIGTLPAGSYQLSWGYNTNPNSLQPSTSFSVSTYYQGWAVEHSQGVITVTMNTAANFISFIAVPSAFQNSATVSVDLTLVAPSGIPTGILTTTFPTELGLSSASCTGCTIVPPNILLDVTSGTTNFALTVSNVQNVGSFKPISTFSASISNTNSYLSMQLSTSGWTNTQTSSFSTSVTGTNNYRAQANTFIFSLTGLSGSQNYVRVNINSAFPAISSAPSGGTLVDSHNLDFNCTSSSCSLNIPLTNPTATGDYSFSLTTYTVDNFKVGTSTSNLWTYDCNGTDCRSCQTNNSCITCYSSSISSFSIFNTASSTCTSACSTGFFLVGTTCTLCDSNCTQCIASSTNCTACSASPTTYYLDLTYDICVPSCLPGQFANSGNQQCNSCTSPCATCQVTATTCLSCVTGTYLHSQSCLTSCPVGTHIANNGTRNCDPCDSNCLTCSGSIAHCLTCNNTQNLYFQNNVCVGTCSSNYFLVNNICQYCNSPCKTCGTSVTDCTSCFLNGASPIFYSNVCITSSQCPTGHYINNTNSSCQVCPTQCSSCSSPTSCSLCNSNFYLNGASCLSTCPNTTYNFTNITSGYCLPCNNCATCSDSSTCTSCVVSQFLYNGICYTTCPSSSFASGSVCTACDTNCPTCQNTSYCLSCVNNMYLFGGTCMSTCPNGTFINSPNCQNCPSQCTTCTSSTNCLTCATTYSLQNNFCVLVCAVGVSVNQVCLPCGQNCDVCSSSTGICSRCTSPYLLYNNTCVTSCPNDQLTNDNLNCVPCSTNFVNCSTCTNTACLSCTYGQLNTTTGQCVPCSPGTYDLSGTCVTCPSSCTTCTSQTSCQTCATSYYLLGSICSATCPNNMIPNGTICSQCLALCSVCDQTTSLCTVCNAGVYLHNNLCYATCPSPLITSYDFRSCVTQQVYFQQFIKDAKIIYFPFTIAAVVIIILGFILRCFHPEMHLQTVLCSIISLIELATWVIFLMFEFMYWQNYHQTAKMGFLCGVVSVVFLFTLNFIHLRFFYKYINSDDQFNKWQKHYGCTNCVLLSMSAFISFKFYRLIHSKFLGRSQLSMILSSTNKLVPFSLLGVIALFLCSAPICVGCALALYNSLDKDQQFWISFDTLVVTGIMALLILMDLRHPDDYFVDEHEAKNLKKKIYAEDQFNFEKLSGGNSQSGSSGHIQNIDQVQGEAHFPHTGQKFSSTFQETKRVSQTSQAKLKAEVQEQEFEFQDSIGEEAIPTQKGKWQPIQHDHHGYLVKHDEMNNPVRYDENGYRVEIDEDGNHTKYNKDGNEVRIIDGQHLIFDADGNQLIDGKPHDSRGYEIREQNGQKVFYDKNGFKVIGYPPDEKHIDQDGNRVQVDEDGNIHRYNQDGYEIVDYKGEKLLKNADGQFVRKNEKGEYEMYDPDDGYTLKANPLTGQLQKYDEHGFRIQKDENGYIKRFDQDGFIVTVLPGNMFVKHDSDGYRIQKDENGKIHRYDAEGYQLIQDKDGKLKFIDSHGYTVQRDIYGGVTLYDDEGNIVVIDPETGKQRRYNQQGLEVTVDANGNIILLDKRGKIVKQDQDGQTFQKFDKQGNKIYLDENGYQVEYDEQGNVVLYDKVGDRVETEYDIEQSQDGDFENVLLNQSKKKNMKYKYKPTKAIDNQAELDKLMSIQQPYTFEEQSQMSDLVQFHHQEPPVILVDHQIQKLVAKERKDLEVEDAPHGQLVQLVDFERDQELDNLKEAENGDQPRFYLGQNGSKHEIFEGLPENEDNKQNQYDKQAIIRGLDEKQPRNYLGPNGQILTDPAAIRQARRLQLNRILNAPRDQEQIQIKSVADVAINQRSFDNEGVQPLENRTDADQLDSIGELEVPVGKGRQGKGKKTAQTQYNYNTVDVAIKNRLYDEEEEIQSLHEDQWEEQYPVFTGERVKEGSSKANTNILFLEEEEQNKDALSDFVQHQSQTKSKPRQQAQPRYNELFSGRSIQQIEQQLFDQMDHNKLKERKQFKLSGGPNPLVEYAKAMDANRKSIQQKMYLDSAYKK